ncbi:MAG: hypothetical protein OFPII_11520 [Osedax symbiont Rs1]|nr:MAG: hypothetical protein OFPII_11520 [Osedax symbiont Rs1]
MARDCCLSKFLDFNVFSVQRSASVTSVVKTPLRSWFLFY